jgi:hypothetical protein
VPAAGAFCSCRAETAQHNRTRSETTRTAIRIGPPQCTRIKLGERAFYSHGGNPAQSFFTRFHFRTARRNRRITRPKATPQNPARHSSARRLPEFRRSPGIPRIAHPHPAQSIAFVCAGRQGRVLTSSFRESPRIISLATYASGRPRRLTNAPIDTISLLAVSWGGPLKREKR